MATKVTRDPAPPSSASDDAEDLAVLHPDVTDEIAGESVTFREYPHLVGLRLRAAYQPIVEGIARVALEGDAGQLDLDAIADVLADHADALPALIGASCGKDPAWYAGLSDDDGERAMHAWWAANDGFFVRRVGKAIAAQALEKARDGQTSTPN